MIFNVCICTHSPEYATLHQVVEAISKQTLGHDQFNVIVVDNASNPKIEINDNVFSTLRAKGIELVIYQEPRLGIAHARLRALQESNADAVVFVDDDNVLDQSFLENSKLILEAHPEVGCFSGKIKFHRTVKVPHWISPLLTSFAIRDTGDAPIIEWFRGGWAVWMPIASASMIVTRKVIEKFLTVHGVRRDFAEFGRKGRDGLLSGEDYLIALTAADAGLQCGYFPSLLMWHFVRAERFRFTYMLRLWFSYGLTDLKREVYLGHQAQPLAPKDIRRRLLAVDLKNENFRARFCYWIYQVVYVSGRTLRWAWEKK